MSLGATDRLVSIPDYRAAAGRASAAWASRTHGHSPHNILVEVEEALEISEPTDG
jgi:hypothetical protein